MEVIVFVVNGLNKPLYDKLQELLEIYNGLSSCKIELNREGQLLIVSFKTVPWADQLKKQYGESNNKIGYIIPMKTSLG